MLQENGIIPIRIDIIIGNTKIALLWHALWVAQSLGIITMIPETIINFAALTKFGKQAAYFTLLDNTISDRMV
jgi:hypothetical protein